MILIPMKNRIFVLDCESLILIGREAVDLVLLVLLVLLVVVFNFARNIDTC